MKSRHAAVAAFAAALQIAIFSSPAHAEPSKAAEPPAQPADGTKEAEAHFHRGVDLYKDGDSGGALVEFKRAYDLSPNYHVLYNLGQTYFQLQRYAEALKTLQAFLSEGGTQIAPEKRTSVENDVRQLQNRVAQVDVKVNVDGAQILIDDEPAGTAPLAQAVMVSVGHRKISAIKEGMSPQDRFVDVAAGDRASVTLEFPIAAAVAVNPAPALALAPPDGPAPAPTPHGLSVPSLALQPVPKTPMTAAWVAWGATGLFAAGTVATGLATLSSKSDLSNQLQTFPANGAAIEHARTRTQTWGLATDALLGATAVAAGVAIYFTIKGHSPAAPSTQVGLGLSGVNLKGKF